MFGPPKPPPPTINTRPNLDADGSTGARVQLRVLCAYLLRESFKHSETQIQEAFDKYGDNVRDLYDVIITMINAEPSTVKSTHNISKMNDIFDEFAGIAIEERSYKSQGVFKCSRTLDM